MSGVGLASRSAGEEARAGNEQWLPSEARNGVVERRHPRKDEKVMIFVDELKSQLKPDIKVRTVAANIEDPRFSKAILEACEKVFST